MSIFKNAHLHFFQKGLILVRAVDHYITVILTVILALLEVTLVGSFYGL